MSLADKFRERWVPSMCLQTNSWTHPPSPKEILELVEQLELIEQQIEIIEKERDQWKDEATKFGKAFRAAAKVLQAIDFTPAHLGKESSEEPTMWMSWARGVLRVWNENKDELVGHLGGTSN